MSKIKEAVEAAGGPSAVAELLGVSVQAVCFWRDGKRSFPPEFCAPLEKACNGSVSRSDMRPSDWSRIWPELVGADAARETQSESPRGTPEPNAWPLQEERRIEPREQPRQPA